MSKLSDAITFMKNYEPDVIEPYGVSFIQPMETAPKDGTLIDLYIPQIYTDHDTGEKLIDEVIRWHDAQWVDPGYWERKEGYPAIYKRLLIAPWGWSPILKFPEGGLS